MARPARALREDAAPDLHRLGDLVGYGIAARDGEIGSVDTFYFDDQDWTVRYVVVATGGWLSRQRVLLSPRAVERIDVGGRRLVTDLTREKVGNAPDILTDRPVSQQHEADYYSYYGYPGYWTGPYRWGPWPYAHAAPYPAATPIPRAGAPAGAVAEEVAARERESRDPHLRSAAVVQGYAIEATDGALGHVVDFLADDRAWAIRYLIVDPRSWWPGPHVLVSPEWVTAVNWNDSTVAVDLTRGAVRDAPEYDPGRPLGREEERRLHRHHGRAAYWERPDDAWRLPRR
jgi:hypothetical protein